MKKSLLSLVVFTVLAVVFAGSARASEGTFNLRNRVGEAARCSAYSVLMQDLNYNILLSCRDILYPGGTSVFSYVVWAVPAEGGNQIKLGTIGLGKASFKTRTAFTTLYVTKESESNVRAPSGVTIMQGGLERNELLDGPAPVATVSNELGEPTPTPVTTPAPRNLGRIFAAGGILAFIAIFGVILVIFVVTRK